MRHIFFGYFFELLWKKTFPCIIHKTFNFTVLEDWNLLYLNAQGKVLCELQFYKTNKTKSFQDMFWGSLLNWNIYSYALQFIRSVKVSISNSTVKIQKSAILTLCIPQCITTYIHAVLKQYSWILLICTHSHTF